MPGLHGFARRLARRRPPKGISLPTPRTPSDPPLDRPRSTVPSLAELVEVAVWTSPDGDWGEYHTFLLRTRDDRWHAVGFADPAATQLVAALGTLPGFDTGRLYALVGERSRRIVVIWP